MLALLAVARLRALPVAGVLTCHLYPTASSDPGLLLTPIKMQAEELNVARLLYGRVGWRT